MEQFQGLKMGEGKKYFQVGGIGSGGWGNVFYLSPWGVSDSEVAGAGVAVVVELLLDVHHVATGVLELPVLGATPQVPQVAELGEPRPGGGVWGGGVEGGPRRGGPL